MALVAKGKQPLQLDDLEVCFGSGEELITEYSYKYAPADFLALAAEAGWQGRQRWSDAKGHFSGHLLHQSEDEQTADDSAN